MAQRHYRPTQYTFTNVQNPEEEKIYNFDNNMSSFTNKIEITYYNYVVVNGREYVCVCVSLSVQGRLSFFF